MTTPRRAPRRSAASWRRRGFDGDAAARGLLDLGEEVVLEGDMDFGGRLFDCSRRWRAVWRTRGSTSGRTAATPFQD